jgi:hypothetical protein
VLAVIWVPFSFGVFNDECVIAARTDCIEPRATLATLRFTAFALPQLARASYNAAFAGIIGIVDHAEVEIIQEFLSIVASL